MAPDERGWHRLYDRATEVLGQEEADELMARVPVTAWTELVTKQDLQHETGVLRTELEATEHRVTAAFYKEIAGLHQAADAQVKTYIGWTGALMAVFAAVTTIAAR